LYQFAARPTTGPAAGADRRPSRPAGLLDSAGPAS